MKIRIDEAPGKMFFVLNHYPVISEPIAEELTTLVTFDSPYYYDFLANPWANDFSYLFEPLNAYWASLSVDAQTEIMQAYVGIFVAFQKAVDEPHQITDTIPALIAELHAYNSVDNIRRWMDTLPLWHRADSFAEALLPAHGQPVEHTYQREDYLQLIALAIGMKALMPVWHLYMSKAQEIVGLVLPEVNVFKRVMAGSSVNKSVAMQRMRNYVQEFVLKFPQPKIGALEVSHQDAVEMLVARLCMRYLVLRMLTQQYSDNLLLDMYAYIQHTLTGQKV